MEPDMRSGGAPPQKPVPLVRVAALTPVVAFLGRSGAPVGRLLAAARLPGRVLDRPASLIPLAQAARLMEAAAESTDRENLGLLAGRETSIDALGLFGRFVRRAGTLHEAIDTAARALPSLSSGSRVWLASDGKRVRLCHKLVDGSIGAARQVDQYCLMLVVNLVRLADPTWRPDDIALETARAGGFGEIDVLSGGRVLFEQGETSISLPRALLARPLARPFTCGIDAEELDAWTATSPAGDFPGSVLQVMGALSSPMYPRIGGTAGAMGVSVRALQRRLAGAGVSYERLIAQARYGAAVDLLERTDSTVLDIALDLGYSDHAHFTRAFRRWTGTSPREFRRMSRDVRELPSRPLQSTGTS
jgi:AraC-like DNA-binding protein